MDRTSTEPIEGKRPEPITVEQLARYMDGTGDLPNNTPRHFPYLWADTGGCIYVITGEPGKGAAPTYGYQGTDIHEAVAAYNAALPNPTAAEHIVEFVEVPEEAGVVADKGRPGVGRTPGRMSVVVCDELAMPPTKNVPTLWVPGLLVGALSDTNETANAAFMAAAWNFLDALGLTTEEATNPDTIKAISDFLSARDDGEYQKPGQRIEPPMSREEQLAECWDRR